jgi:hypothetical protein
MKEQKYAEDLDHCLFLSEKGFKLSAIDNIKIDDKPAVGVSVKSTGHREVNLFFDATSGLPF